ncbi:Uncharacterised protein [Vibrio cholerae]|uniref:Uncharacterized protein n=1 Tax=Vibrio cholerae TaxID=666 RepID=A0A655NV11_VIBCL|nr:Uncharacterised protein [Vibrio cholerae]
MLWPLSRFTSIQGISDPASGTPKLSVGKEPERMVSATFLSISKMELAGLASSELTASLITPICEISSRIFCAPAPDAAW